MAMLQNMVRLGVVAVNLAIMFGPGENSLAKIKDLLLVDCLLYFFCQLYKNGFAKSLVQLLRKSKFVQKTLNQTLKKEAASAIQDLLKGKPTPEVCQIPEMGWDYNKVLQTLEQKQKYDLDPFQGKSWAYVYEYNDKHKDFMEKVFGMFVHTNVLNPMKFISLRNMEVEVVAMTAKLLHGDENCVGSVSSGGSESILLACKTYRDYFRSTHPDCAEMPQILMCVTAHPAFNKAAKLFDLETVIVPSDPKTLTMDLTKMEQMITKRTAVIIGSAPSYPHGMIDPIEDIAAIGLKHNIPVHVDMAVGGFSVPFIEKLGYAVPKFDFRCKGVTSINADVHKYGYCPKGASVIVYRNSEIRNYQFICYSGWPGGLYISPTLLGTRNGGPIAAAWASLISIGENGYLDITKKIMEIVLYFKAEIPKIHPLTVIGNSPSSIVSFTSSSKDISIYSVADAMDNMGWHMERQRLPDSLHLSVMGQHQKTKEQFIEDLKKAVLHVKENPQDYQGKGSAAMQNLLLPTYTPFRYTDVSIGFSFLFFTFKLFMSKKKFGFILKTPLHRFARMQIQLCLNSHHKHRYGMIAHIPDNCIIDEFLVQFLDKMYAYKC